MDAAEHLLFPTRLLSLDHGDAGGLNAELADLFGRPEFADDFDMHPDSLNLLGLAERQPPIARVREMFLAGLRRWLDAERVSPEGVDLTLFCNAARRGEFTMVHNHSADLVGIYYVQTPDHGRDPVHLPDDGGDYFAAEDGVLVLHDPRFNANLSALQPRDHVKVFPRPGLMLIFPGYLWHSVTPHLGGFRRLALSMNFSLRWPGGSKAERHAL